MEHVLTKSSATTADDSTTAEKMNLDPREAQWRDEWNVMLGCMMVILKEIFNRWNMLLVGFRKTLNREKAVAMDDLNEKDTAVKQLQKN